MTGIGTFAQEVEDGLTVRGVDGTGAETMQMSEVGGWEPLNSGDALFGGGDGVGEEDVPLLGL